jgi:hypothetical protein
MTMRLCLAFQADQEPLDLFSIHSLHLGIRAAFPHPNPASRARIIACARSATCNLLKMLET